MTREEAITVLKAFMENPLFSDAHKAAFNIAIHDIKQRHDWDINNLILINKDNYEPNCSEIPTGSTTKDNLAVDAVSRQEAIDAIRQLYLDLASQKAVIDILKVLPSVTPQEPKIGHCKDCKYFEYDSVAKIDGVPLIVAHEICSKWGRGCKTNKNGYCFLFKSKSEVEK